MKKILGMGNALVDILTPIDGDHLLEFLALPKGSMQLVDISKTAEIEEKIKDFEHTTIAGGSAANTVKCIAQLGGKAGFIGKIGNDNVGNFFEDTIKQNGITPILLKSTLPSGRCNVLISKDHERTMATCLGAAADMKAEDIDIEMFKNHDIFHIEGYLMQNYDLIDKAGFLAKKAGLAISIDFASYNIVTEHLDFLKYFTDKYADIIFANEEESFAYTQARPEEAVRIIGEKADMAIVKIGAKGSYISHRNEVSHIQAVYTDNVIDTTGAGDIFAAGYLFGMANNFGIEKCGQIGALCASEIIQSLGAKMSNESIKKILYKLTC